MGAYTFHNRVNRSYANQTADSAFVDAVQDALYEHGHGGYTGTIAEKHDYTKVGKFDSWDEAVKLARSMIDEGDSRIDDKWGPAGCIEVTGDGGGWLFFGWASS